MGGGQISKTFEVGRFLLLPDRKLCGFLLEAENKPGLLSEISKVLGKHNVNILCIAFSTSLPIRKSETGLIYLDLTDADASAEELARETEEIKAVKSLKIIYPPTEGFIVDNLSRKLLVCNHRVIIIPWRLYKGLLVKIREELGTAGEVFLYYSGFHSGFEIAKLNMEMGAKLGLADPEQILKLITLNLLNSLGYGKLKLLSLKTNPAEATIRVYDSFECELGAGSRKPFSAFLRGIIAGISTVFLNEKMSAKETKCIAKGDPYCEFIIKPEKRMQ